MRVCLLLLLYMTISSATDIIPGKPQEQPIALVGGDIHTVSGKVVTNGTIVFDKGKITAIGSKSDIVVPKGTLTIDISGRLVYPGLIAPHTTLGLIEIGAVRASNDTSEVGFINPNARADTAYNTDSEIIPTVRSNGVLTALIAPNGGLLAGTSSVLMLDGWTKEDATLLKDAGLHLFWPNMKVVRAWWMDKSDEEQLKSMKKNLQRIEDAFDQAHAYYLSFKKQGKDKNFKIDARWQAMVPLFESKIPLLVHATEYKQIEAAVDFCVRRKFKMILVGGADSWRLTGLLKKHSIAVILQGTHNLPQRQDEPYDIAFRRPKLLHDAGIKYCLSVGGGFSNNFWNARNLPFQASTAVAFGLSKNEALRSITLSTAEILGVADRIGSLEVGKDATLIVSRGDCLDVKSNHIEYAFMQGRKVDLDDRHKKLYRKYQQKYK